MAVVPIASLSFRIILFYDCDANINDIYIHIYICRGRELELAMLEVSEK